MENQEIWKKAFELEGYYECSTMGNVRSVAREINASNGKKTMLKPKTLKNYVNRHGYVKISICGIAGQKKKTINAHRLIAQTFIPNPENKPQVNHINGIKTDNRVENLEWATREENMQHAHKLGLMNMKSGEEHFMYKIKSSEHPRAKAIIDLNTKTIYGSIVDASKDLKIKEGTIRSWLNKENNYNPSSLVFYSDYITNNGWTAILSENDLPSDKTTQYSVSKDKRVFQCTVNCGTVKHWYNIGKITHYQPIKKPLPPIV